MNPRESNSIELEKSFVPAILKQHLASYPDWNIGDPLDKDHAAILWIDISNFSPLCDRLMKNPLKGVEKIKQILESHYDFLLKTITDFGGQPLFFVGDGLMSAWPCTSENVTEVINQVVVCGKKIIDDKKTLDDQNNKLSLHMLVSYGTWRIAEIRGIRDRKLLSFFGDALTSLSAASINRDIDQVLVSKEALPYLSKDLKRIPILNGAVMLQEFPKISGKVLFEEVKLDERAANKIKEFTPITLSFPLSRERLDWCAEVRPITSIFMRFPREGISKEKKLLHMYEISDLITPIVTKYDGLLYQVWIDEKEAQLLICFGPYPSAHVDNPERSVRLGMELQIILKEKGIKCGIGICSGKAYSGILGNDILRQHTVIGNAVNLSARLAQQSKGEVICDRETKNSALKGIEFESPVFREIKGHQKPIETFIAKSIHVEKNLKHNYRKSVGRDKELEILKQVLKDTSKGQSEAVIILGESGIGKSKLLKDFEVICEKEKKYFLKTAGDFLTRNSPYSVWSSIFSELLGMKSMDSGIDQKDIIEGVESKFGSKACLLNVVLNTNFAESKEVAAMSAYQRVVASHDLLLEILKNATQQKSVVIIIDDAQWMDSNCWELIKSVKEQLKNVLFVISIQKTGEVEEKPYEELGISTIIELNELREENLKKLISECINAKSISEELRMLVEKIAKGNPFFSLEFIGSLNDENMLTFVNDHCALAEGVIIDQLSLPDSVHGAVRRRIDMLDQGSLLSLKVGSVVGQKFGKSIVETIYPITKERSFVPSYLEEAHRSGFLNEALVDNTDGYFFNNATTAKVAYEMTLAEQRRHLHQQSAEWYEKHFAENLQPFYLRLAHHWEYAENMIKASEYLEMESNRLLAAGFVESAIQVGLRGINLFDFQIEVEPEKVGGMIGQTMQEIAEILGDRSIEKLSDLGEIKNPEILRLIVMLIHIGPTAHVGGRLDLFALMSVLALKTTLKHGNSNVTADVYSMYAIVFRSLTGDSLGAFEWSKLALKIDEKYGGLVHSRVAHIHNWFLGHWVRPIQETYESNRIGAESGKKHGDLVFECYNLASHVVFLATAGEHLDTVIEKGREQFKILNKRVMHASFHIVLEIQLAKALKGVTTGLTEFTDDEFNEQRDLAFLLDTPIEAQKGFYMVAKIKILTHFGFWDKAVEWADRAIQIFPAISNQVAEMEFNYYGGIAMLNSAYQKSGFEREKLLESANASIDKLKSYAAAFALNFEHKALLLEGIKEGLYGDENEAILILNKAVEIAKKSPYPNDYALAIEHLVRLEHRIGMQATNLNSAVEAWNKIGAAAKAIYLTEHFN